MAEATVNTPQRPKLMIRSGKKVTEGVEVKTVFAEIKSGKLKRSDEFSMDGENWRRLDQHVQLAKVFAQAPPPKSKSGKGLLVFLFLLVLVAVAGAYFHPYLAFYNTQIAADSRNVEKLSQWVDYPALRLNIKEQADAQWNTISPQKIGKSRNAKSALFLGRQRVDQWIDTLVTPEAVMAYSKGETDFVGSGLKGKIPGGEAAPDPLENPAPNMEYVSQVWDSANGVLARAEYHYQDLNTFVATLKMDNGDTLDIVYERRGIDWKVAGVELPAKRLDSSITNMARWALKQASKKGRSGKGSKTSAIERKKQAESAKLMKIRKAYMANLELLNFSVGKGNKYLFGSPNPGVFAALKNNGNQIVKEVEVTLYFFNKKGAIASEKKVYPVSVSKYRSGRDNDSLGPGGTKKVEYLVKGFAPASWAGKVQIRVTDIGL